MYETSFRLYLTTFVFTSDMIFQKTFLEKSLIDKPAIFSNQSPHREHCRCEPLEMRYNPYENSFAKVWVVYHIRFLAQVLHMFSDVQHRASDMLSTEVGNAHKKPILMSTSTPVSSLTPLFR